MKKGLDFSTSETLLSVKGNNIVLADYILYKCLDMELELYSNKVRKDGKKGVLVCNESILSVKYRLPTGDSAYLKDIVDYKTLDGKAYMAYTTKNVLALNAFALGQNATTGLPDTLFHGGGQWEAKGTSLERSNNYTPSTLVSPIISDSEFWSTCDVKPFLHQKVTTAFMAGNKHAFVFNGLGTGKTKSALWALRHLMNEGLVKKVLILAPLSCLKSVWYDESFTCLMGDNINTIVLHGASTTRVKQLRAYTMAKVPTIGIINHDGPTHYLNHLLEAQPDMVIVDEASAFKNHTSIRHKNLSKIIRTSYAGVIGLTGTPISKSPSDAWGLAKLVLGNTLRCSYGQFFNRTQIKVSEFKFIPRSDAVDVTFKLLTPQILFSTRQCVDLPPLTYMSLSAEMSAPTAKMYKKLKEEGALLLEDDSITATNGAVILLKMQQICCGAVKTDEGITFVEVKSKLNLLLECFEKSENEKMLVFVPFKAGMEVVRDFLEEHNIVVKMISGDTSLSTRSAIFEEFNRESTTNQVLLAIPQTMSHGINLTGTAVTVFFAPIHSYETFTQAVARTARPGQKRHMTVFTLSNSPLEEKMYSALEAKHDLSNNILTLCRDVFA